MFRATCVILGFSVLSSQAADVTVRPALNLLQDFWRHRYQDGTGNAIGHPAAPDSIVTVYAAGFGQTAPASVDGLVNDTGPRRMNVASLLGVQIAGQSAPILYAGPAPGQVAGVSQINFRVPRLAPGTYTVYIGWGPAAGTQPFLGDYNSVSLIIGQP